ncbi:hypothetical protein N7474_000115 [Penicillium riverlandense]|uniref:uncharacterized protein n=1 Tax=Penicillium riverlandense TaxID=1903569 RepID=UPI0025478EE9|nr:uncharacterized protein N7474_000115 [Penicillium riverlandense]KAJ5831804.1 hypothetical protein N7474_000115 [Penicillium riverlandense]
MSPLLVSSLLLLLLCRDVAALPDQNSLFRSDEYSNGEFGSWPVHNYRSSDIQGPLLNYWSHSRACDDGKYTLLTPRGASVNQSGPTIIDEDGNLVWFKEYGSTYNANVYQFRNESYLTFWAGKDSFGGRGDGTLYMLNKHYEEAYKIRGANGLSADLHEFWITSNDTALLTSFALASADLRMVDGPEHGYVWDGVFQEVDVETNELLFEWRASEHFSFEENLRGLNGGKTKEAPWDFFHLNSVDKDERGNYLVSSRYMACVTYIDGHSGDIIWKLGGLHNYFTDLSGGNATNIKGQHHARFQPEYNKDNKRAITVFDNGSGSTVSKNRPTRGLFLDIDEENMTAEVRHEYWNPIPVSVKSQGSVQVLDNGNVLLGYGYDALWTEFSMDGEVLCDVHFAPEHGFGRGRVISYRVSKHDWVGLPKTNPSVSLSDNEIAVSWNGATEVATWVLEGTLKSHSDMGDDAGSETRRSPDGEEDMDDEFTFISAVPKSGFETIFDIPPGTSHRTLRVVALNSTGHPLGVTESLNWDPKQASYIVVGGKSDGDAVGAHAKMKSVLFFAIGFLSASLLAICLWLFGTCSCCAGFKQRLRSKLGDQEDGRGEWKPVGVSEDDINELNDLSGLSDEDEETGGTVRSALLRKEEGGEL